MTGFPEHDYTGPPEAPVTAGMTGFPEQDYTGPPGEDGDHYNRCRKWSFKNKKYEYQSKAWCDCILRHPSHYCTKKFP